MNSLCAAFEGEFLFRVPRFFPRDDAAFVRRIAAHRRRQRAFDTILRIIAIFVFALARAKDAGHKCRSFLIVMFI